MKKKEKKYGLLKGVLFMVLVAIILSWFLKNGSFGSTGFVTDDTYRRIGLYDLADMLYYSFSFAIDKAVVLLAVGGLYGVLSKVKAYDRIVSAIAKKVSNKKVFVVLMSVLIAVLTSVLTNSFAVVVFIPFIISILNRMRLDKMTILATTFGSMLVGIMGATYGTDGFVYFNRFMSGAADVTIHSTALVRFGILVVGLALFNFFLLTHMNKKDANAETTDMFWVEETALEKTKGNSVVPIIIIGVLLLILVILGFVAWETIFPEFTAFSDFHKTITDIHIKDFYVFTNLLGPDTNTIGTWTFGAWDSYAISSVVFLFTIILGLCYRVGFNDFVKNVADGMKKMIKPILCVVGAYLLMVVVYKSTYVATIMNQILSITDGFNLVTMTLTSLVANIFHTDLAYTTYISYSFLASEYVDYINPVYVIFTSLYGFVQFFIPTSIFLGIGLTSLDVKYKDWLKYIWKFLVGMFICLLVVFILVAVI